MPQLTLTFSPQLRIKLKPAAYTFISTHCVIMKGRDICMNSYTDLSLACLSLADDLYKGSDLTQSLALLQEICRRDPVISTAVNQLPRTPLPDFRRQDDLYTSIYQALEGTTIEDNPNWLMFNLFMAENSRQLIRDFPNKMLLIRGISNFARSIREFHEPKLQPYYEY